MKTELKAKYIQYLSGKKQEEGFTLIELLVVIIIIGILSAIALPSFLNQANKAKQSEAKTYVGSMNRTQQAYFLENTGFTSEIGLLGLGIQTNTANYSYAIVGQNKSVSPTNPDIELFQNATNQGIPNDTVKQTVLKSYLGGVATNTITATSEATTVAVLCEQKKPEAPAPVEVAINNVVDGTCPDKYQNLSK